MGFVSRSARLLVGAALVATVGSMLVAQDDTAARVTAIKQWLGQSKAALKQYQWLETTVVSHKGEVKSTTEKNCYYDVSGQIQKVPVGAAPEEKEKRGIRGAIAKDVKDEMADYMKEAVALVKTYVPPSPEKIQASKDAGKMSIDLLAGGQNIRLNFHDYEKPGDNLAISIDKATNKLLGIGVNSFLDSTKDAVVLAVTMGALPDGTGYAQKTVLDATAKELQVTVTNTGYRKGN